MGDAKKDTVLNSVYGIVFKESENLDEKCVKIEGYYFSRGVNHHELMRSLGSTGFKASNLWDAIELDWSPADETIGEDCNEEEGDMAYRKSMSCKVFLGFTSNLISSGVRDIIGYLAQHHMVDIIVATAGGIEEDLIKCLAPTYKGDFCLSGAVLRSKGLRNGADFAVFINTAQEFDWSDSGARPDEAMSWAKLRSLAKTINVHCDATIAFPLLVAETFAAHREFVQTNS